MFGPTTDQRFRDLFGADALVGPEGNPERANQIAGPNAPDETEDATPIAQQCDLMAALYGSDFPLIRALHEWDAQSDEEKLAVGMVPHQTPSLEQLLPRCEPMDWVRWVRGRWALHRAAVETHLWMITRNRLFRAGQQWVSSRGVNGPWREPNRPADQARVTHNLIGPALDQRCQVITDQRPGFEVEPDALSADAKRKAEGRQRALEYQFDQQKMTAQSREATYWAQTDGVAFWEVYWDREAGPWDERMGTPDQKKPLGDLRTRTRRVEHVRVSANATASEAPYYAIVRDVIPQTESAYLYGIAGVQRSSQQNDGTGNDQGSAGSDAILPSWILSQTTPGEGMRMRNIATVERFTMYIDRHPDVLPDGLQLVTVGDAVIWGPGELLFGCIPIIPVRDGSTDPSYYPRPIMEYWIPPQQRINAALSLWVNSVRVNSGGRFLAKPDAISRETFVGSGCSIIEVECSGPLGEAIQPVNGFLVGQDVKDLIAFDVKAVEDMSGYNDVSRGQVSGETATAVATANEQLQRVFAPPVEACADAFTNWAEVNIAGMAWGYDLPRDVGAIGSTRPDLARALSSKDFDGPSTVKVEPAKMMPMPAYYRKQQLDDLLARQLITPQQYMRNIQFKTVTSFDTPDEDQEARAKRVVNAMLTGQEPEPLIWQTNEAIEQDVLERDILLQPGLDPQVYAMADARWKADAQQQQMKMGAQAPPGAGGPSPTPGDPTSSTSAPPALDGSLPEAPPAPEMVSQDGALGSGPPMIGQ